MGYIVVEIQTDQETVSHLTFQFDDQSTAEQKYHTCLAAAAVSDLTCHAVAMLDSQGRLLKREMYKHDTEEVEEENNG